MARQGLLLLFFLIPGWLSGQTREQMQPREGRDTYLKLYTGVGVSADSDLRIRQPSLGNDLVFHDVSWDDKSLSRPSAPYTGIRFGTFSRRNPWLGLAVDLFHFKIFAETERTVTLRGRLGGRPIEGRLPMDAIVQRFEVANGVNMVLFNALGRLRLQRSPRFPHGRVQPYAGLGAGPTVLYTVSRINDTGRKAGYELGKLGLQTFAGLQYLVSPRFDIFLEAKLTYTEANGSIPSGTSETEVRTNHLAFGGGFHF